ncbi:hypothetical protein Aph02nite_56280 [Actinoplanes philippinensis]|uniref:Lipoprotein LprG n=2 Tax=Actinoplanes philippinensis TaxID=35752 RepID=A0A1I2J2Y6_9ACTN|nr:hypothetical protein Aph02nite_56280 [Actinoplanes philippinensis]SFF48370.1 hypothetical protein SAMN05421541_111175 [Actinoplanes philippinensis]
MKFQRLAAATVTLTAAIGIGGCATGSSGTAPAAPAPTVSATPVTDPLEDFVAATKSLEKESMKVSMTMTSVLEASGSFDIPGGKADMTMRVTDGGDSEEFSIRLVGKTLYMKLEQGSGADWMSLDVSALPAGNSLNPKNMVNTQLYTDAAVDVTRAGNVFQGKLDLAKAPDSADAGLRALGKKGINVPFTAEIDDQGRLTELSLDMTVLHAKAGKMTAKYFDFGTEVKVAAPPAGEVAPMPKEMVKILAAEGQTAKA